MKIICRLPASSKCISSLILCITIFSGSFSQGIKLDSSFHQTGILQVRQKDTVNGWYYTTMDGGASAVQPDGKLLFGVYKIDSTQYLRFNVDGSPDSSFGENGIAYKYEPGYSVYPIKITTESSGKIIVLLYQEGDIKKYQMARYFSDGKTDSSFGINGKISVSFPISIYYPPTIESQPDGKILLAGSSVNEAADWSGFYIIRFNIDGSPDVHFGNAGTVFTQFSYIPSVPDNGQYYNGGAAISGLAIQPDGKIIAVGTTSIGWNGIPVSDSIAIVRYNTNGSFDTSFSNDGKFIYDIPNSQNPYQSGTKANSVCLQADNKIVVSGGWFSNQIHGEWQSAINIVARLLPDGTLDSSFSTDGVAILGNLGGGYSNNMKIFVQSDGKIVTAGNALYGLGPFGSSNYFMYANRFTTDGTPENNFYLNMPLPGDQQSNPAYNFLMAGQRIYAIGESPGNNGYNNVGGVFAFKNNGAANNPVNRSICQSTLSTSISSDIESLSYLWQISTDSIHFINISDNEFFSGANTKTLSVNNALTLSDYQLRCLTENSISNTTTIHLLKENEFEWTGTINNNWEEARNWLCNTTPNSTADVFIKKGSSVIINTGVIVNSLKLQQGASLTIQQGATIKVTK